MVTAYRLTAGSPNATTRRDVLCHFLSPATVATPTFLTKIETMSEEEPYYNRLYHRTVVELMSFVRQTPYTKDSRFTAQELGTLTPVNIKRWMCTKVYGIPNPGENDKPKHGRSSSLEYYKKAISAYMPNKHIPWDSLEGKGNPTRSKEVSDLIKAVEKAEVRSQGKDSEAVRPMEMIEYRTVQSVLAERQEFAEKYLAATFMKLQFSLIARVDDISNLRLVDIMENSEFPFALKCKICWSKNIWNENAATQQILLGAMDTDFCVLLGLAIYLETWTDTGSRKFLFADSTEDNEPKNVINRI
jgi:hypothetical protein